MGKHNKVSAVGIVETSQTVEVNPLETLPSPQPMEDAPPSVGAIQEAKAGKADLRLVVIPDAVQQLIDSGIRVRKAVFHRTVLFDYAGGMPEHAFYSPDWSAAGMKKTKTANMWYTPHGLICEQNGIFKIIPLANVSDTQL